MRLDSEFKHTDKINGNFPHVFAAIQELILFSGQLLKHFVNHSPFSCFRCREKRRIAGPIRNRSCTDIPCCIVFAIFIVGFLIVTLWSFAMGDYKRVVYPTNSQGQICGRDVVGKPYLFFFDLQSCLKLGPALVATGCPTPQVCVESCPEYYWSWRVSSGQQLSQASRNSMICLDGVNANDPKFSSQSIDQLVQDKKCAPYVYHSKPILGRCMPSQLDRLMANGTGQVRDESGKHIPLLNANNQEVNGVDMVKSRKLVMELVTVFEKIVADLRQTWHVIVTCILISVVLSFCWIVLLRYCATVMVWTTLALFVALFTFDLASYFRLASTWLALGIVSVILLFIIICILIFLRNRIRVAIAILNETSKAVASMTTVLLWPLLPFILEMLVIAQVLFVALSLRTIADPIGTKVVDNDSTSDFRPEDKARKDIKELFQLIPCDPLQNNSAGKACRFLYYGDRKYTIYLQLFNLFMFFWLVNFVRSLTQMTLAGTFAEYYFSRADQKSMSKCPLLRSFFRSAFYHIGSLAFGSFLIALLQWLRAILEYISTKLKKSDNPVAKFFLKYCIYGQSFCSASGSALALLARNVVRLIVVDKVTDFILFIGKLVVVGAVVHLYVLLRGGWSGHLSVFHQ
ncbi:unnamed protein product [Heterobilharzia americana]|nr:unnamed protein product [Heterobilharzia americana]